MNKGLLLAIAILIFIGCILIIEHFVVANGDSDIGVSKGEWHCEVKYRDDLHRVNAFFAMVELYPPENFPATSTPTAAELLGYMLIEVRGVSVPSQFPNRTRAFVFAERERKRFDKAMSYVWALFSECESLIIRNPKIIESQGYVIADVFVVIGGHTLNLSEMLINDGHARPAGDWDWGSRIVVERIR